MGRGSGEFIAVTHCGGGGGGRADDMANRYQREIQFKLAGRRTCDVWVWGGDHKVGKMTGPPRRFPPQLLLSTATPP